MPKQLKDYTPEELQEIGRKTVASNIKSAEKAKADGKVMRELFKAYQEGKVKLPG